MTFFDGYDVNRHRFSGEERGRAGKARSDRMFQSEKSKKWDELSLPAKKRRVLQEQDGVCNMCGVNEWQGLMLVLEFHHKNGDIKNNDRDNVEYLCPNCHSQTPTDRFRNRKHTQAAKIKMRLGK